MKEILLTDLLQDALRNYRDEKWLGINSPLAWPYFLGKELPAGAVWPEERGKALQTLLQKAIDKLQGKNNYETEECQTLLRQTFLTDSTRGFTQQDLSDQLGMASSTYKRKLKRSIELLGDSLLRVAHPALQLETPPESGAIYGRESIVTECLQVLEHKGSVTLLGVGGVGKSAVAAEIAARWREEYREQLPKIYGSHTFVFWYTIRPDLNDRVETLIFSLGLFAHHYGSSALWQELVATNGGAAIRGEKTLDLVRSVLLEIKPSPLLCFDEIDLLQLTTVSEHAVLLRFWESLRSVVPLLFISQRPLIDVQHTQMLQGLSKIDLGNLYYHRQIRLSNEQQAAIYQITQGNPRLVHLLITAISSGENIDNLLDAFNQMPTLLFVLTRTVAQLSTAERSLLMKLSIFPSPIALHAWQTDNINGEALNSLLKKQLVQSTDQGIEIPPIYRSLLERELNPADRQIFHLEAAHLRSQSGTYTSAAYHLIQAGEAERAFQQWKQHQSTEIMQGQAATALALFRTLSQSTLSASIYEQLQVTLGELSLLTGHPTQALADLQSLLHGTSITAAKASELAGRIHNHLGEFENAEKEFTRTLKIINALIETRDAELLGIYARKGRTWGSLRQRRLDRAEIELHRAAYEIENMYGILADERREYMQAEVYYLKALKLAETIPLFSEGIAKTCNNLAIVYRSQGRFQECTDYLERAYQNYQQIGKISAMAGCWIMLAVTQNLSENYAAALNIILEAENLLQTQGEITSGFQALFDSTRAEAYLGLGALSLAQSFAQRTIESKDINLLPDAYRVYGEAMAQQGQIQEGIKYIQQAIEYAEQNDDRYLTAFGWRALGRVYKTHNQIENSVDAYRNAIEIFEELKLANEVLRTSNEQA